jgi:hypothetical protein
MLTRDYGVFHPANVRPAAFRHYKNQCVLLLCGRTTLAFPEFPQEGEVNPASVVRRKQWAVFIFSTLVETRTHAGANLKILVYFVL